MRRLLRERATQVVRKRSSQSRSGDEDGSVLLLALGYAVLAIAVILVCVCATDLYIAQKRLDALADSAALAGAGTFELVIDDDVPRAELDGDEVRVRAADLIAALPGEAMLVSADTPDGVSARVVVEGIWRPPLFAFFVPDGVRLQATGTGRTALN